MSASPRITAIALAPALPIGTSSPPSIPATATASAAGRVRLTSRRGRSVVRGKRRGRVRTKHHAAVEARQCDCTECGDTAHREPDVHGPVGTRLAIFAGAVDRVDDPHALHAQAAGIVFLFLGQQPVVGPRGEQRVDEEAVGGRVARLAQFLALVAPARPHFEQDAARFGGEFGGEVGVAHPISTAGSGGTFLKPHGTSAQARSWT